MLRRTVVAVLVTVFVALGLGVPVANASGVMPLDDQKLMLRDLGINNLGRVVVDSAMTYQQAIGDSVVPEEGRAVHAAMKPHLRVVPVAYWGLSNSGQPDGRVHVGQIVVHRLLVRDTLKTTLKMFQLGFPIHSVIPQSAFGYSDAESMAANNSSNYRPESGSEHGRAAAFDWNPVQNPFDITGYNPNVPVQPAGAVHDPTKPGTLTMDGAVRKYWASLNWEWGGNWGNPDADPPTDFFRKGFFDWQHFQLNAKRYDAFVAQLPPCVRDWTCV